MQKSKKHEQPNLLVDYLDGSKKSKKLYGMDRLARFLFFHDCVDGHLKGDLDRMNFRVTHDDEDEKNLLMHIKHKKVANRLMEMYDDEKKMNEEMDNFVFFIKDKSHDQLLLAYRAYKRNGGKNYVFSPYLSEIMANTGVDVPAEYLMIPKSGFIYMPNLYDIDNEEVLGIFFEVSEKTEHVPWFLRAGWVLKTDLTDELIAMAIGSGPIEKINKEELANLMKFKTGIQVGYICVDLPEGQMMGEQIETLDFTQKNENGQIKKHKHTFSEFEKTILNAIIYVLHSDEDQKERFNEFAQKKSKREKQQQILTTKPFIHLDKEKPKKEMNYNVTETFVKGHGRWQPYGPNRSKLKHIYIQPTTRHYKKGN